ncbi:MAG: thioredoxin [Anaerolineaceae bacterium]|nr:MAG: thioredoxin [Anaerolineaceae bacterium]
MAPVNVTDNSFQQEVIDHELPVLVDFWAEWCGPCRAVAPVLDKLAEEYAGKVRIAKVNVDENPGLSQYFQIMSIPTMMMFKEQTVVFNQAGALPEPALRDLLNQLVELEIPPRDEAEQADPQSENAD